jgi:transposase, IS5 family
VLQTLYTLSDEQTEYQLKDRLSFMRFAGLALHEPVPDATTIWLFREKLTKAGAIEALFARFDQTVRAAGYIPMSGQIVDASLVAAPRQRTTEAEKADIQAGRIPQEWQDRPARLRQKDRDARWTVKVSKAKPKEDGTRQLDIAVPAFGYQNHISIDRRLDLLRFGGERFGWRFASRTERG